MDIKFLKTAVTIFIIVYLSTSFIMADINFMNWEVQQRSFMIICFFFFVFLVNLNKALSE